VGMSLITEADRIFIIHRQKEYEKKKIF
jgi:hypothetical protein